MSLSEKDYAVAEMARSEGWKTLASFIAQNINSLIARLTDGNFDSLYTVALLQGEIRGLRTVLHYVNTRVEKARKEDE